MVFNDKDWTRGIFFCEKPRRYLIVKSIHVGAFGTFLYGTVIDYYGGLIADRWFRVVRSTFTHVDVATCDNSSIGKFPCDNFITDSACQFPQGMIDWFRVRLSRRYVQP